MNNLTCTAVEFFKKHPLASTGDAVQTLGCSGRTARRAKLKARRQATHKLNARILLFDIETIPMEVYVWGLFKQRISPDNIIKEWSVVSWAAKWLFENDMLSDVAKPQEAAKREDGRLLKGIHALLDEADIVVAHNANRFDVRRLNARFIVNNLPPPRPFQVIDTLREAKRHFAFSSYKVESINPLLGLSGKIKTTFDLWKRCVAGDESALAMMQKYNKQDVLALEELYVKIRPWIKGHPNMGLFYDKPTTVCPNCGSGKINWGGEYRTQVGVYDTYRCESCGAIGRNRKTTVDKKRRERLGVSVAR